jgi:probable rRNA maturation factor
VTRSIYRPPWRIDVDVRDGIVSPASGARLARAIASALGAARPPWPASIGLILTDDTEIAALNVEHMGHEGPTDVLSFPLLPPSAFAAGRRAPNVPRPPGSRIHLGDIVVSVERAVDQASTGRGGQTGEVRWSPTDELCLLVTHGTLHICGWDHATPDDEREMRALEQRLLGESAASGGDDR